MRTAELDRFGGCMRGAGEPEGNRASGRMIIKAMEMSVSTADKGKGKEDSYQRCIHAPTIALYGSAKRILAKGKGERREKIRGL